MEKTKAEKLRALLPLLGQLVPPGVQHRLLRHLESPGHLGVEVTLNLAPFTDKGLRWKAPKVYKIQDAPPLDDDDKEALGNIILSQRQAEIQEAISSQDADMVFKAACRVADACLINAMLVE